MRIPSGIILFWPWSNASIPYGYTRETALDGRYPKGSAPGVNPGAVGGSSTHSHTSPPHSHAIADHTHTYSLTNSNAVDEALGQDAGVVASGHGHTGTTGGVNSGGQTGATAITYGAFSNDPPYKTIIFIRSLGYSGIPDGMVGLWTSVLPTGWRHCNGLNGDPNYADGYIKGAPSGQDAGATGGNYYNNHDISHSHTVSPHNHSNSQSSGPNAYSTSGYYGGIYVAQSHSHTVSFNSATQSIVPHSGGVGTTQPEVIEPLFKRLIAIINRNGRFDKPKGLIGIWLGNITDSTNPNYIPRGWVLCDGQNGTPDMRSYFVKMGDGGNVGAVGGSNTHGHQTQVHGHSGSGTHSHSAASISGHSSEVQSTPTGGAGNYDRARTSDPGHGLASMSSPTIGYLGAGHTADVSNNEPDYLTVAFIQFKREVFGGAALYGHL